MKANQILLGVIAVTLLSTVGTVMATNNIIGNDPISRALTDTRVGFSVFDTNNPADHTGYLGEFEYYAAVEKPFYFVITDGSWTVKWVSAQITPTAVGVSTYKPTSEPQIQSGWYLGLYYPYDGVVPFDWSGNGASYTFGGQGVPVEGKTLAIDGVSDRTYSYRAYYDDDGDGVLNAADYCPGTVADSLSTVPTISLGVNRWVWYGTATGWKTTSPKGTGPSFKPIMDYTNGCSCAQILNYLHAIYPETYGNMVGQYKYGCSQSILQDWHNKVYYIETVSVPANKDTATFSTIALQNGKNYELKAYGTATACWESGCQITFDAEYSTSDGTNWVDGVAAPYNGYGPNLLDLMVNGGFVDWGAYNSAHTYWLPVSGTGSTLPLQVYDIYYPNNAGNINVDIYAKL